MKIFIGFLILINLFLAYRGAEANILCRRDAVITPVDEVIGADGCTGSAKLQGISYKCTDVKNVLVNTSKFIEDLSENAEEYCTKLCKKRGGSGCKPKFIRPYQCGFSVPQNRALDVGDWGPCGSHCEGPALSYCSIYRGGFLTIEEKDFKDKSPNCYCQRG